MSLNKNNLSLNKKLHGFCQNCGKYNHIYTECLEPILSFGLICFNNNTNIKQKLNINFKNNNNIIINKNINNDNKKLSDYNILLVKRKHSINYVEFLRGKYDENDIYYIFLLLSKISIEELEFIINNLNFKVLRDELQLNSTANNKFKHEYEIAKIKFNYILKLGYLEVVIKLINELCGHEFDINPFKRFNHINYEDYKKKKHKLLQELKYSNLLQELDENTEWGIPKGRREEHETDLQCAIREFTEETGISSNNLFIYKNILPLEETLETVNGKFYKFVYFICELLTIPKNITKNFNEENNNFEIEIKNEFYDKQNLEVSQVKFCSFDDALSCIRNYNVEKKKIIQKSYQIITQMNRFFEL